MNRREHLKYIREICYISRIEEQKATLGQSYISLTCLGSFIGNGFPDVVLSRLKDGSLRSRTCDINGAFIDDCLLM